MKSGETAVSIRRYAASICRAALGLALLLPGLQPAMAADTPPSLYALQHRTADELLPLITPLLRPGETASGMDYQLILRVGPESLNEINSVLAQLDRPPRRLLLSVKQITAADGELRGTAPALGIGQRSQETRGGARVLLRSTQARDGGELQQQVHVIDGGTAFIEAGKLLPITDFTVEKDSGRLLFKQDSRYVQTSAGFYAQPRVNGDSVTVVIGPWQRQEQGGAPPLINTHQLGTTVSGKLGEWLWLGGTQHSQRPTQEGLHIRRTATREAQDKQLWLRVTELQ